MERECEILIVDDAQTIAGGYGDSTIHVFELVPQEAQSPPNTLGGAGGIRTPYLLTASQTLSQLSYSPTH